MNFRINLLDIHSCLEGAIEFTRKWMEDKLEASLSYLSLEYHSLKKYPLPYQRELRCMYETEDKEDSPFFDVNFVFLAGEKDVINFAQKWIGKQFPTADIFMDKNLEIVTAIGAAIHGLQLQNEEVEPYVKLNEHQSSGCDFDNDRSSEVIDEEKGNLNNEIIIEQHESDIASQSKSSSEKKSDNLNACIGFDRKVEVEDDQVTATPPLETGSLETKKYHNTTDVESSQEKVPSKEKALLP